MTEGNLQESGRPGLSTNDHLVPSSFSENNQCRLLRVQADSMLQTKPILQVSPPLLLLLLDPLSKSEWERFFPFWCTGLGRGSRESNPTGFIPATLCPCPYFHQSVSSVLWPSQAVVLSCHGWKSRWGGKLHGELRAGISKFFWSAPDRVLAWLRQASSLQQPASPLTFKTPYTQSVEGLGFSTNGEETPIPEVVLLCWLSVFVSSLNFRFYFFRRV